MKRVINKAMDIQQAYNRWAGNYDTVHNKTRDLEAIKLRETLSKYSFTTVLEIGCGTGKNTQWLLQKSERVQAIDFSNEMLAKAKEKIKSDRVEFTSADITNEWTFIDQPVDLVAFSLVLEHIQNLDFVFQQARKSLKEGGFLYLCELHPFKQYLGSKARFETGNGVFELDCFTHHVSDFLLAAQTNGFDFLELKEWFDNDDRQLAPRLLTLVFKAR